VLLLLLEARKYIPSASVFRIQSILCRIADILNMAATSPAASAELGTGEEEGVKAAGNDNTRNSSGVQQVERHYFKKARQGIILKPDELQEYCRQEGIKPLPSQKQLRNLRYRWKYIGMHARWKKPPHYVGASVDKLGNLSVDVGEFGKNLAVSNKNRFILLVAVDLLSQRLGVIAFPNKKTESWEKGIVQFIKEFPCVHTIITDRDVAITSERFQARIKEKYQVDWMHLRNRSKSYAAERALRYLKDRLGTALALNESNDRNWLKHLDPIVADYNNRMVKGATIKRVDVRRGNVMQLLAQKYGVKDFTPLFNTSVVGNFSKGLRKAIGFKHEKGSKVLLSRSANYNLKTDAFLKKSAEGSYGKKVYVVEDAYLKSNAKQYYSMVYRLKGMEGFFYASELIPALFSEEEGAADEDAADRRKKAVKARKRREQQ
jgi:hypothetical protein